MCAHLKFEQAKLGFILVWDLVDCRQFLLLFQPPQLIPLYSKVVKSDSKVIIWLRYSKSMIHSVEMTFMGVPPLFSRGGQNFPGGRGAKTYYLPKKHLKKYFYYFPQKSAKKHTILVGLPCGRPWWHSCNFVIFDTFTPCFSV